jgi:hypothetical protein
MCLKTGTICIDLLSLKGTILESIQMGCMMADGNTGDSTAAKPVDHAAGHPTPAAADGHIAKLQADGNGTPGDKAAVKDSTQVGDKNLDKVKDTTEKPAVDSYTHLHLGQLAANEIASYMKSGKKETDTVTVKGADGVQHTEKVADRVLELKKTLNTECAAAIGSSNNIKQADVAQLLQAARTDRKALAHDLGLGTDKFNTTAIAALRKDTTDSATLAKLDKLAQAQTKVDTYKLWENAPAYSRMLYSSFKAAGLADPESGLTKDPNGGLKASQKDILDAVSLLSEAGTNKDLRSSRLYVEAVATVLPKLENSSEKVKIITADLDGATKAGASGDKAKQAILLKDAVDKADQTNTAAIAQMLRDPRFVASQRNPAVLADLANNVVMSSTARLQYAQLLSEQGKFGEAQGLVLRVKTECPEVMYGHDANDPTKLNYNQSRYVDMAKLDQTISASSTVQPNQIKNLLDDFSGAMGKGQIVSKDGVKGAQDIMTDLYAAAHTKTANIADGLKGLDTAQKGLDQKKADLAAKKYLTDDARTLDQKQIDREQSMIQQQRIMLEADAKDASRLTSVVKLYDAGLNLAEDKRDAARSLLADVKKSDPELAAEKGADGKDTFFATIEKGSQEPSWWDRNWRKVATAGAIVAGGIVGVATFWSGPGAVLCGVGTTAALMTSMGLAVGAGAVAGAATFAGTHEALYHTGVIGEKVDLGKDLRQGASIGAMSAFMFASLPAMAGVGAIAGGAEGTAAIGATGAATEANTAVQALTWGGRAVRLGAVSFSGAAPWAVADYYGKEKADRSVKEELKTVVIMTALPMIGGAAGAGVKYMRGLPLAAETLSSAPKVITAGNLLWGTGGTLAMNGLQGLPEWQNADALGPAYAFDESGKVAPYIQSSTSLFGPYNATRGWEASRQQDGDLTGELSLIDGNWGQLDPGFIKADAMSTEKPTTPITNTVSDFTDAAQLGKDTQPDQ